MKKKTDLVKEQIRIFSSLDQENTKGETIIYDKYNEINKLEIKQMLKFQ